MLGGVDEVNYEMRDTVPSCDKSDHRARSIACSPVHEKHWKKVGLEVTIYERT